MSGSRYEPATPFARAVHRFEENFIALMLGLMVALSFANVVARYVFNASMIWVLETVLIFFAWMVLFGIAYGFKITANLGVDAVINLFPDRKKRIFGLISGAICMVYALLLIKGAYDYWAPFAGLDITSGRWFPTGLQETRSRAFYETEQVPMLPFLRFLEDLVNDGDPYEKLPRVVPYAMLPVACVLMLYRILQATRRIWNNEQLSLIVSHEAEEAVEDAARKLEAETAKGN